MSRLIDRILISPKKALFYNDNKVSNESIKSLINSLKSMPIVIVDNAVKYYFEDESKDYGDWNKEIPIVSPPFKLFFIETKRPKIANFPERKNVNLAERGFLEYWGAVIKSDDIKNRAELKYYVEKLDLAKVMYYQKELNIEYLLDNKIKWISFVLLFGEDRKYYPREIPISFILLIDEKGNLISYKDQYLVISKSQTQHWRQIGEAIEINYLKPLYLGISMMHCKNISKKEILPDRKLSKKHEKKHGNPLLKYYVLQIGSKEQGPYINREDNDNDTLRSLHICRGHFKNFDEKPLFGKIKGTFWWGAHIRGNKKKGIILKDYKIDKPKK